MWEACHVVATGSLYCYNLLSLSASIVLCVQAVRSVDDVNVIYKLMAIGSRYLSRVITVLGSICAHRKYWYGVDGCDGSAHSGDIWYQFNTRSIQFAASCSTLLPHL